MDHVIKVGVVGAGAAGLASVRLLACQHDEGTNNKHGATSGDSTNAQRGGGDTMNGDPPRTRFEVTVFEQTDDIGGTWRYTDHVGKDEKGLPVHTSMYKNLRTNLPKESMHFPDFPFPSHLPSFPGHQDVLKYLHDYTHHFGLRKHIQFLTRVDKVTPIPDDTRRFGVRWEMATSDVTDTGSDKETHVFDAILVCSGQFSVPRLPTIPGLDTFKGHVVHSHDYRMPDGYRGQKVAVLGGHLSGQEITIELAEWADKVYLCHDHPSLPTILPPNVEQTPGIASCDGWTVTCRDGETRQVDAIILCTGYLYDFSFLDESVGLNIEQGRRVTSLYKHFLSTSFPSLGLVGIIQHVLFFPYYYLQIKYFRSILNGTTSVPSKTEMVAEEQREFDERTREGTLLRHIHDMKGEEKFRYYADLARLCGLAGLDKSVRAAYEHSAEIKLKDVAGFRNYNYDVSEDGQVTAVKVDVIESKFP